jgi:hypothetical protein
MITDLHETTPVQVKFDRDQLVARRMTTAHQLTRPADVGEGALQF